MPSKYQRKSQIRDPFKKIIIAMEGNTTEPNYFSAVKKKLQASSLKIILLTRDEKNTNSAPIHIIEEIKNYKKKDSIDKNDELWLIIDKDRWPDSQLSTVAEECITSKYNLGLSNPCFEIWLILHYDNLSGHIGETWSSRTAHDRWNSIHAAHNISSHQKIADNILPAIDNAKELDKNKTARWPNTIGTRVYKLAESIVENSK